MATTRARPPARRRHPPKRVAKAKPAPRPRRRGRRAALYGVLLVILALPFAVLAWYAEDGKGRIPEGSTIAGIDVGGLDREAAIERLRAQVGSPLKRAVQVDLDGTPQRLTARRAGVSLDIERAVGRAVARGERGNFILRGWRELTGAKLVASDRLRVRVDRSAVKRFVERLATEVYVPAKASELSITLESVGVSESSPGRELDDPDGLTDRLVAQLKSTTASRRVTATTRTVDPPVSETSLFDQHPTVVTVSRDATTVRVFDRGELTTTYGVAVGSAEFPTPTGTYTVQSMQVDPAWNVPNSEWAGDLAGETIPGGAPDNPLKKRWIGFNGSVGFHGTGDIGSLGSAASHGCVRMDPKDVIDLYERVDVGTTVYVA